MSSSGAKKDDFDAKLEQMMNRVKQIQSKSPLQNAPSTESALSGSKTTPPPQKPSHASISASHSFLAGQKPPKADANRRQSSNSITIGGKTIGGIPRALSARIVAYQQDESARSELKSRAKGLKKAKEEQEAEVRRIKREAAIDFTHLNRKVLNAQGAEETLKMTLRTIHRTSTGNMEDGDNMFDVGDGDGLETLPLSIGPPTLTNLAGYSIAASEPVTSQPSQPPPYSSPITQRVRKTTLNGPAFAAAVGLPLFPSPPCHPSPLPPTPNYLSSCPKFILDSTNY